MEDYKKIQGFVVKKNRDLNENLFWEISNNWQKYRLVEDEDYYFCVAREYVMLINCCIENNIPFFIDLDKKLGNENVNSIFDIRNNFEVENDKWWEVFKDDTKRKIVCVDIENLAKNYINNDFFVKTVEKGWHTKNLQTKLDNIIFESCGYLENYKQALYNACSGFKNGSSNQLIYDEFLVSEKIDFNPENEYRVIFVGNQIHSIASKDDYCNKAIITKELQDKLEYLAKKYYKKVPYLIWNIDIDCKNLEIIEIHLNCQFLGKFYGNNNYKKMYELL